MCSSGYSFTGVMKLLPERAASCLDGDCELDFFFVTGMRWRQFFHLQNVHAEVTDFTQG
jgi:hypothetical protein